MGRALFNDHQPEVMTRDMIIYAETLVNWKDGFV